MADYSLTTGSNVLQNTSTGIGQAYQTPFQAQTAFKNLTNNPTVNPTPAPPVTPGGTTSDTAKTTSSTQTGAVYGQAPSSPSTTVKSDVSYGNNQRLVTYEDGTTNIVNQTRNPDGSVSYTPDINQADINNAKSDQSKLLSGLDDANKSFNDTINSIKNGAIPLDNGQQAQISALQSQYNDVIQKQVLANTAAQGLGNIRGYQKGAAEYDPTFQAKTIGSIVSAGQQKIAELDTKMAGAVADLTDKFKQENITLIKAAWDQYQQFYKDKNDALQKTISDSQAAIKDAQTQANWQTDMNLKQMTFDEKVKTDQFDQVYKMEDLALKRKQTSLDVGGTNLPVVQTSPSGAVDKASQQQFLSSLPGGTTGAMGTAIQGLTSYTIDPNTFSSRIPAGQTQSQRQQLVTMAKQFDPSFDEKQYSVRAKYQKDLASNTSGTVGGAINSANKAVNHLTAFVDSMSQLPSATLSSVNYLLRNSIYQLSPTERQTIKTAQTEGVGVADELAKFFKGTGASDVKSVEDWKSQLSTNGTPSDIKGLTQGAITLLSGQLETLSEQYQRTMGKPPTTNLLGASAITNLSNLKNQGYKVDIPGILYTDKNAYVTSNPNAQDNLKSAYDQLKQSGLPTTPENILQVAQELYQ